MASTLCVIDMQPEFRASFSIRSAVVNQINIANKLNDAVVLVEFFPFESTHYELIKAAQKNNKFSRIRKYGNDGSHNIITECGKKGYSLENVRVCGVNRAACVLDTIEGLAFALKESNISVIWAATLDQYNNEEWHWAKYNGAMETYKNIRVER